MSEAPLRGIKGRKRVARGSPPKRSGSGYGGRRQGSGGRLGNRNAMKFKAVGLPRSLDLHTREGLVEYVIRVIGHFASGLADARREGTHSQWVKLLADINGWIPKAPLQIIQAQTQAQGVSEEQVVKAIRELIRPMPDSLQAAIWEHEQRGKIRPLREGSGSREA
jgi:hypothetical protein